MNFHKSRLYFGNGALNTMIFSKNGPIRSFKRRIRDRLRFRGSPEEVFTRIHDQNMWGSRESLSGPGSEFQSTENLRRELPVLVKDHRVKRLLDVPYGDFNWMQHVLPELDVEYIGGDIVKSLVEQNQKNFGGVGISFSQIDLTSDPLPDADMMLVRDCLFHLSHEAIYSFLQNFCQSDIGLLLTTTHMPPTGKNAERVIGGYGYIYLFSPPFSFPNDPLEYVVEDNHTKRSLLLFDSDQVQTARDNMKQNLGIKC